MVYLDIPKPLPKDMQYSICNDVDRHNRRSFDDLKLKKHLRNHSWDSFDNMSIFGVSVVEAYNVATQCLYYGYSSNVFFYDWVEYIIDNNINLSPTKLI